MNIWSAWLQGRKNAPKQVQQIFQLWEDLNPDSKLHVLESEEVSSILHKLQVNTSQMTPQVKTNIARTYLLSEHGGVWVDSTLFPTRPLNTWLTSDLCREGFFAFRSSGRPSLILQNWFLYAKADNVLINTWLDFYVDYFKVQRFAPMSKKILFTRHFLDFFSFYFLKDRQDDLYFVDRDRGRKCRMYPYALHNFSLAYLLETDKELKNLWKNVPKLFNIKPSLIGSCSRDSETPDDTFLQLALDILPISPVHKLNHRDVRFIDLIDEAKSKGLIYFG
jgi:hypothetical protein